MGGFTASKKSTPFHVTSILFMWLVCPSLDQIKEWKRTPHVVHTFSWCPSLIYSFTLCVPLKASWVMGKSMPNWCTFSQFPGILAYKSGWLDRKTLIGGTNPNSIKLYMCSPCRASWMRNSRQSLICNNHKLLSPTYLATFHLYGIVTIQQGI